MKTEKMEEEKIISFISGQLEPHEREKVLRWISESPGNREEYYKLKNLWAMTSPFSKISETKRDDRILFRKNIRSSKNKILKNLGISLFKYAAVAVIALWTGKFIFNQPSKQTDEALNYNEITVPPGQMAQVTLSDGTRVFINSSSYFRYPAKFSPNERRVFISGEAFFEVKKNKSPFLVEADKRIVKVLGTKFDVMAYPKDRFYQATLVEGKIGLMDKYGKSIIDLEPGEQYSFDTLTHKQILKQVRTELYDSWKDGIYIFDHETLGGITDRLERIFAVKIHIKNDSIRKYKFTGTLSRNIPFEQILKIIQISAPIKYKIKERNNTVDEVYLY